MIIAKKDLIEHYRCMKKEPFYKETIDDIIQSYTNFLNNSSMTYSDDEQNCAKQAIAFEYHDDRDLIDISEPDKTLIVLAIAAFLLRYNFPFSYMTEQMKADLINIIKFDSIKKYKKYYSVEDFAQMSIDIEKIMKKQILFSDE